MVTAVISHSLHERSLLKRHVVAVERLGDGVWSVFFGPVHLGWLDEADYRIMGVKGRRRRRR
jgi:hypothetical protein